METEALGDENKDICFFQFKGTEMNNINWDLDGQMSKLPRFRADCNDWFFPHFQKQKKIESYSTVPLNWITFTSDKEGYLAGYQWISLNQAANTADAWNWNNLKELIWFEDYPDQGRAWDFIQQGGQAVRANAGDCVSRRRMEALGAVYMMKASQ